jgi:hypothetical protein
LLVLLVLEASLEHLVNDDLHLLINHNWAALLLVGGFLLQLNVFLNAVVDQSFDVLRLLVKVELLVGVQSKSKGFIELLEVVVNFGGNRGCESSLWELLAFGKWLTLTNLVNR